MCPFSFGFAFLNDMFLKFSTNIPGLSVLVALNSNCIDFLHPFDNRFEHGLSAHLIDTVKVDLHPDDSQFVFVRVLVLWGFVVFCFEFVILVQVVSPLITCRFLQPLWRR